MIIEHYGKFTKICFVRYKPYVADEITVKGHLTQDQVEDLIRPIGDLVGFWTMTHGNDHHYIRVMSQDEIEDHK